MEGEGSTVPQAAPSGGVRRLLRLLSPWGPPLPRERVDRKQRRVPLVAGALAGAAALDALLVLRFSGLAVFIPEVAVEWTVDNIPGSLESTAIGLMGGYAKVLALAVAVVAFVIAHSVFALYYARAQALLKSRWLADAGFAAVPAVAILAVLLPLFGEGVAGERSSAGMATAVLSTVLGSLVYAGVLDLAVREIRASHPGGLDITRRTLLQATAAISLVAVLAFAGLSTFVIRATRLAFGSVAELFTGEVTTNDSFYVVSKNLDDPAVNPSMWSLTVDGLVGAPLVLSSNELLSRSASEEFVTLECVSNPVGGNLIGNARWSGVALAGLIDEAQPKPSATWVILSCADGYTVGVPLIRARAPTSLVALLMNGERLPRRHGFPARILVPGLYGMFHAKWLTRITLTDREYLGYWQEKGWTNKGVIRPTAIIAVAPAQAKRGEPASVGGVALAGDRQITRVEVSDDGGRTWALATLKPPLAPTAWTLWTYAWSPSASGSVHLIARAWSQDGGTEEVQESAAAGPYPEGAAGYDSVQVAVS